MTSAHHTQELGAFALGALEEPEARVVAEHLVECAECRSQLTELKAMGELLGEIPPEAFLDGPPEGADLVLPRTLRRIGPALVRWSEATGPPDLPSAAPQESRT